MTTFSDDVIACANLVRDNDPIRFRAIMASPVEMRPLLFPLFAFNIEMTRAAWASKEPMIAEMRLQWWYDALEEIAKDGIIRRHFVITPLALAITPDQAKRLQTAVEARRWDIYSDPFNSHEDLQSYLEKTSAPYFEIIANRQDGDITALSRAIAASNFLRAIPDLIARGKRPLYDGKPEAVRDIAKSALHSLTSIRMNRTTRLIFLSGYLARHYLEQAAKTPETVHSGLVTPQPFKDAILFIKARLWSL